MQSNKSTTKSSAGPAKPETKTKRTKAQIEASRRNGAKSKGPVTGEGKKRSSKNNLKHGLRATLENAVREADREHYAEFRQQYLDEYRPAGPTENTLVDCMIYAAWQIYRCRDLELHEPIDLGLLGSNGKSERVARYRASHERALYKALTQLRIIQTERCRRDAAVDRALPRYIPPSVPIHDVANSIRLYGMANHYGSTPYEPDPAPCTCRSAQAAPHASVPAPLLPPDAMTQPPQPQLQVCSS